MRQAPLARLLVVDDDRRLLDVESEMLEAAGYEVSVATSAEEALPLVEEHFFDLLILDEQMVGMTGSELLEKSRELHPDIGAIFLTGYGDVDTAVRALRLGAVDFLRKGRKSDDLVGAVRRALNLSHLAREKRLYWYKVDKASQPKEIIGRSAVLRKALDLTKRVAPTSVAVLLQGETGTGKELFARAIHEWSQRKEGPFLACNCAAIPRDLVESTLFGRKKGAFTGATDSRPGYFEAAHRGTIFLDEVGEMPFDVQPKLLRALELKRVTRVGDTAEIPTDVRVIAATNRNLRAECDSGKFRDDLYYRLSKVTVQIPPLRDRGDDIELLVEHVLALNCREFGREMLLSPEALAKLKTYSWPGNMRELDSVICKAIAESSAGDVITAEALLLPQFESRTTPQLPDTARNSHVASSLASPDGRPVDSSTPELPFPSFQRAQHKFEAEYFQDLLDRSNNNRSLAAKLAGLDRGRLYNRLYKVGLAKKRERP